MRSNQGLWGKTCTYTYDDFFHLGGAEGWLAGLEGVNSGQGDQTASISFLFFSLSFLFLSLFVSNLSLFFSNLRKRKEKGKEKRKEKKERERKRKERDRKRKENSTESGALPVRTLVSPVRSRSPLAICHPITRRRESVIFILSFF